MGTTPGAQAELYQSGLIEQLYGRERELEKRSEAGAR
jgi:hypothetical protein